MTSLGWARAALALLVGCFVPSSAALAAPACGDSNGDGGLSIADVRLDLRCLAGRAACSARCDVTADAACSVADAHRKLRYLKGRVAASALRCRAPAGSSRFVSAEGASAFRGGFSSLYSTGLARLSFDASALADLAREIQEGDIYRLLGGQLLLNLNAYRGLQIIDLRDLARPRIAGRLRISGRPVEMHVVGDRAFVLLDQWNGYYARPETGLGELERREGGLVLAVDLGDPSAPRILDEAPIPGPIRASRLARTGDVAALYVASSVWQQPQPASGASPALEPRTRLSSFDVSSGELSRRGELDVSGHALAVQATSEALLVARSDATGARTLVSLVDIRDPGGAIGPQGEVSVPGRVENQFNLDLHRGILRVVSEAEPGNSLATFDARSFTVITPIARASFGAGERLFATLFLGNKAFFVSYRVVDPFHAFEIGEDGSISERAEFVVSGWNDFFRAAFGDRRLIGVGVDDQRGRKQAVSLYDITELANPSPLLARAEVELDATWSEASFDHRAFSVLEDAVAVAGPGGVTETGLVLLPYQGFDSLRQHYEAGVQIFSFSESTLTRRASMHHGTAVRRSFAPEPGVAANLSEEELGLFDLASPDRPNELGRVDLAPSYSRIHLFGDHAARVRDGDLRDVDFSPRLSGPSVAPSRVEIIPRAADPDTAAAVARFEIPGGAQTHRVGQLLVVVSPAVAQDSQWPYTYQTTIEVWDLRDPRHLVRSGALTTDRLQPAPREFYPASVFLTPRSSGLSQDVFPVGSGLVFAQRHLESELVGREEICWTVPAEPNACYDASQGQRRAGCRYAAGTRTCSRLGGAEAECSGDHYACVVQASGASHACETIDPASIATAQNCDAFERERSWERYTLEVLDLSDPSAPAFAEKLELPRGEEAVSALAEGPAARRLWLTTKLPATLAGDARPHARYFIREIQLANPASPRAGDPVNVPGELIAVDATSIYTRDAVWGDSGVDTAVARLELFGGSAYQQARRVFEDRAVEALLLDGAGHLLVSHGERQRPYTRLHPLAVVDGHPYAAAQTLSVLDERSLAPLSSVELQIHANLRDARVGRALYEVPGGVLIADVEDAGAPFPRAFFETSGFPQQILSDRREILIPAGRHGIHRFELDAFDLRPPPD